MDAATHSMDTASERRRVGGVAGGVDAEFPALVLRFTDVLAQIDDMPESSGGGAADVIAERRRARRGEAGQRSYLRQRRGVSHV